MTVLKIIESSVFQNNLSLYNPGNHIWQFFSNKMNKKDTHFIGVRVGCLKIDRNSDKKLFSQKRTLRTEMN